MADSTLVHATHRCARHGCKYGDADCPVKTGATQQKNLCYFCRTVEELEEEITELQEELAFAKALRELNS